MDWQSIYNMAIATIPSFSVLLVSFLSERKQTGKTIKKFPDITELMKTDVTEIVGKKVELMEQNNINFLSKLEDKIFPTIEKLENYSNKIENLINSVKTTQLQNNYIIKTSKASFEIISTLVSKDANMVKNGVATMVINQCNKSKEEFEKMATELSTDYEIMKATTKELFNLVGEVKFKDILEEIGYEEL